MPNSKDRTFVSDSVYQNIKQLSSAGRTWSGGPNITYDSLLESLDLIRRRVIWLENHIEWTDTDAS